MSKNIVVQGCDFEIIPAGAEGLCNVIVTSIPSTKTKADNKNVYTSPLAITVTYTDSTSAAFSGGGSGSINSTATKTKADNESVMLENDSVIVHLVGVNPTTGVPIEDYPVTVKISDAGQNKVKGV